MTSIFLTIGILGTLLSVYGKVSIFGGLSIIEAAVLRVERAQQLLEASSPESVFLSGLAFLCYPAGFVGVVLALLSFERSPHIVRILAGIYGLLIFMHGLVTGGRSTILVLSLFVGLAAYLRYCNGQSAVPKSGTLRGLLAGLLIGFLGYSTLIWQVRADVAELDIESFLRHAEDVWGVTPAPILSSIAAALGNPSLETSIMSSLFYVTQSFSVLERILELPKSPVMLGAYHIDLVAAVMRTIPDMAEVLADEYDSLLQENIYGFFPGAWGALYIDFGLWGSYLAVALWGWFSGIVYQQIVIADNPDAATNYAFVLYSILVGFVSPPLGLANSGVTFAWFIGYYVVKRWAEPVAPLRS